MPTLNDLVAVESDLKRAESEIARLTAELDEMRTVNERFHSIIGKHDLNMDRLTAERDRLREALTELAELGEVGMKPDYGEWLTFHDKVAQVARRALEQSTREQK